MLFVRNQNNCKANFWNIWNVPTKLVRSSRLALIWKYKICTALSMCRYKSMHISSAEQENSDNTTKCSWYSLNLYGSWKIMLLLFICGIKTGAGVSVALWEQDPFRFHSVSQMLLSANTRFVIVLFIYFLIFHLLQLLYFSLWKHWQIHSCCI